MMANLVRHIGRKSVSRIRQAASRSLLAAAIMLSPASAQLALADILNTAQVSASTPSGGSISSLPSSVTVLTEAAAPSMTVAKSGVLADTDGSGGDTPGDTITYTVTVENTGNVSILGLVANDPLVTLTLQSGDTDTDGQLDIDETWIYGGNYLLTQADFDSNGGGDGDIDNTVTVSSTTLPDQTATAAISFSPLADVDLDKILVSRTQLYAGIFEYTYRISVENTGTVTQTNVQIVDDLAATFPTATVSDVSTPVLSGGLLGGAGNPLYDGVANIDLLAGPVSLAPGASGEIEIVFIVNAGAPVNITASNTALFTSDQITTAVSSDDPEVTPDDPNDTNPTPDTVVDTDGDGAPDNLESALTDRDGDGVPDADDYDPTGYFYCQADGRILAGGLITVENLTGGGSQTGVGSSSNITVLRDGSDGQYQFHVTAPGTYRLSYALPGSGLASDDRLPGGTLDATSLLPANPGVLGSGQIGATGFIGDFTAGANPFHLDFTFEAGDPLIFNNNIPLMACGTPQLGAQKTVAVDPVLQNDGRSRAVFRLTATNSGNDSANDVNLTDDLAAVFGPGNFQIANRTLVSAPAGIALDNTFNGQSQTRLLQTGAVLQAGESVVVELELLISAPGGNYTNTLTVGGTLPLDGSPLTQAVATAPFVIVAQAGASGIIVQKVAGVASAAIGDRIPYTLTFTNPNGNTVTGVEIIDQIPPGFAYIANSATIDGVAQEPTRRGVELVWTGIAFPANSVVTVRLVLAVGAVVTGDEFINYAFLRDPLTGTILTNVAQAVVRREIEPAFDCAEVIGKVFKDVNRDGYLQDGEPGLPGVRVATARGLLVTTDANGRFHITCPMIPSADIGSNFIVKLDTRTLPGSYRVTSENPRVIRLTRGKLSKLNFGAMQARVVRLELNDDSFVAGGSRLKPEALKAVAGMLNVLEQELSILRIVFDGNDLGAERVGGVRALVEQAWQAKDRPYGLEIETQMDR